MHPIARISRRLPRRARLVPVAALAVPALALSACGGDNVPSNAVARVGDETITKTDFNHWLKIASIAAQGPAQGDSAPRVSIPVPPDFAECVAQKQKSAPKPAKGQPKPTAAQFKQQCEQEYEALRDQVLQLLIQNQWVTQEAKAQGIEVSEQEIQKAFEQQKKASFPEEKDFQQFLKTSGFTMEDIKLRIRLELLSNKLREQITKGKDKVTAQEIKQYYEKNKQRFAQPERRDIRMVLTRSEEAAEKAKAALEGGQSFKEVAKRFSIDQASKEQGGVLLGVAKGQQERALDEAIFKAKKGELVGPIKTQFGHYVFKVQKITPKSQQSLQEATATIKALLASQNQQKALDTFIKEFQKKYREDTTCAEGFRTQDCENAPKRKPQPQQPGQPPQGGQPQPAQPAPQE